MASLVKLPLGAAVLAAAEDGVLDLAERVHLDPATATPGPTGLCRFRHSADVAVGDLLHLCFAVSDDTAADALFERVSPAAVTAWLTRHGMVDIAVRHPISDLYRSISERMEGADLAIVHRLVVAADGSGAASPIPQLDPAHANAASARGMVDLLALLWSDAVSDAVRRGVRELLGTNLMRQRLAPDLTSERMSWFSKTGTFVNLRHEAGVVEHVSGRRLAVAALTRSRIPVAAQPSAEAAMGHAARLLVDHLLMHPAGVAPQLRR
jgi:beta-lactamase class A